MEKFVSLKNVGIILVICGVTVIAAPAQTLVTLHSFDVTDGSYPQAWLVQATDGNFYGTTSGGGAYESCSGFCGGTVFKITPKGTLATLHSFAGANDSGPLAGLVQAADGNFYGTTQGGGASSNCANGCGTVFKITPKGTLTTLHSFDGTDGSGPVAGLIQATDGNFYGTTFGGGTGSNSCIGCGTVFKITPTGALTTLHSFGAIDGSRPAAELVQGTDGNFYGTTFGGNCANSCGTVFKITPKGTLTTLRNFDMIDGHGYYPSAGLIQGTDGNFYGTTSAGGASSNCANGCGTVFKITPRGTLTTLHSFDGTDGSGPETAMVQATDGKFYGITTNGGNFTCNAPNGCGTIFNITPAGTLTTVHSFDYADGVPTGWLIQSTDGNFYGTNWAGGAYGYGTVFSLSVGLSSFPRVTFSTPSLGFGNQAIDTTSVAKTVTVANTGSVTLDISSIMASGSFAISANTCGATLAVGNKCKVSATFTPTVLGKLTGALTLTDNAPNGSQTVVLSGTGIAQGR